MEDVVLITADSLRADYISYFNADSPASTPHIDMLAKNGMAFHTAIANGPHTVLSAPTLLTGEYQPAITAETPTLAERLADVGYVTAGFCTNVQLLGPHLAPMELERGFKEFDTLLDTVREKSEFQIERVAHTIGRQSKSLFGKDSSIHHTVSNVMSYLPLPLAQPTPPAATVNNRAIQWIDESVDKEDPYFLWLFHLDTHEPWLPPTDHGTESDTGIFERFLNHGLNRKYRYFKSDLTEREIETLQQLYVASIEYWDAQVGELVEELRARDREPTIIITSDHGELLGEHGEYGHPAAPWEELLNVPIVVSGPAIEQRDSEEVVQNIDVVSTILDLADAPSGGTFRGTSLIDNPERTVHDRDGVLSILGKDPIEFSYRTDNWKYVRRVDEEALYDMTTSEPNDVYELHERTASELADRAGQIISSIETKPTDMQHDETDEDVSNRLRSLGYLED